MKKLKIYQVAMLLGTLAMGSLAWGNDKNKYYAECTTYRASTGSEGYEFHIPRPNYDNVVFVKGKYRLSPGSGKEVEAVVRHSSWITTSAKFEFEGKHIEIDF
jgi:hypothetical protein